MAAVTLSPVSEKFIDKYNPEDPEIQRELIRPVEIKEDVKLMEQRKRVTLILKSRKFRKELESAIRQKCKNLNITDSASSLLSVNYVSDQLILAALPKTTPSAIGTGINATGIVPINDLRGGIVPYGRRERQMRCKLSALHRFIDMFSWCGSVSARIAKDQDKFLVKPFSIFSHEVTASCFISVDMKGNVLDPGSTVLAPDDSNWTFHSAIHSARPEVSCIIHLKTSAAINVSSSNKGLLPISVDVLLIGEVFILELQPSESNSTEDTNERWINIHNQVTETKDRSVKVFILPNHGIFVCGNSIEETWFLVQKVQSAAEIQEALSGMDSDDLYIPDKETQQKMLEHLRYHNEKQIINDDSDSPTEFGVGEMEFEAVMRHLDNSGYRTGYLYQMLDIYKSNADANTGKTNGHNSVNNFPDVEIPPVTSSVMYSISQYDEGALSEDEGGVRTRSLKRSVSETGRYTWFNTPNVYKRKEETPEQSAVYTYGISKKSEDSNEIATATASSSRWVSARQRPTETTRPHHPITAGAHVIFEQSDLAQSPSAPVTPAKRSATLGRPTPQSMVHSSEFKLKQKRVKDRYYHDTTTAGPQSSLLDGLTWEEARRLRDEGISQYLGTRAGTDTSDRSVMITAASKGIVQRNYKSQVVVLENVFKHSNPFEQITDEDLKQYQVDIDRKQNPEKYEEEKEAEDVQEEPIVIRKAVENESAAPSHIAISQSLTHDMSLRTDPGLTSDSDYPGDSLALHSMTLPPQRQGGTLTSETSAAEFSHDDTLNRTKNKDKKKRKMFKNPFKKKKKDKEVKEAP